MIVPDLTCLEMCAAPKSGVGRLHVSSQHFQKELLSTPSLTVLEGFGLPQQED